MKALTVGTYVWMAWMIVQSPTLRYLAGAFLAFIVGAHLWYRWRGEPPVHDKAESRR